MRKIDSFLRESQRYNGLGLGISYLIFTSHFPSHLTFDHFYT